MELVWEESNDAFSESRVQKIRKRDARGYAKEAITWSTGKRQKFHCKKCKRSFSRLDILLQHFRDSGKHRAEGVAKEAAAHLSQWLTAKNEGHHRCPTCCLGFKSAPELYVHLTHNDIHKDTPEAKQAKSLLLPKDEARLMRRPLSGSKLPASALPRTPKCPTSSTTKMDSQTTNSAQALPIDTVEPLVPAAQNDDSAIDPVQDVPVHTAKPTVSAAESDTCANDCSQSAPVNNARSSISAVQNDECANDYAQGEAVSGAMPRAPAAKNDIQAADSAQHAPPTTAREVSLAAQNSRETAHPMQRSPSHTAKIAGQEQAAALVATVCNLSNAESVAAALQSNSSSLRPSNEDKQQATVLSHKTAQLGHSVQQSADMSEKRPVSHAHTAQRKGRAVTPALFRRGLTSGRGSHGCADRQPGHSQQVQGNLQHARLTEGHPEQSQENEGRNEQAEGQSRDVKGHPPRAHTAQGHSQDSEGHLQQSQEGQPQQAQGHPQNVEGHSQTAHAAQGHSQDGEGHPQTAHTAQGHSQDSEGHLQTAPGASEGLAPTLQAQGHQGHPQQDGGRPQQDKGRPQQGPGHSQGHVTTLVSLRQRCVSKKRKRVGEEQLQDLLITVGEKMKGTLSARLLEQIWEGIEDSKTARQFMIVEPEPYSSQVVAPKNSKSQQEHPSSSDAAQQAP